MELQSLHAPPLWPPKIYILSKKKARLKKWQLHIVQATSNKLLSLDHKGNSFFFFAAI